MKKFILTLSVLFIILISLSSKTASAQINYGSTQSKTSAVTVTKIPYYELNVYPNPTKCSIYQCL